MIGGLSDILGMGITIQLRNMFTIPASQVANSSRGLANAILGDQNRINTGLTTMAAGGSMLFLGTGLMALFYGISKATLKASSDLEIFRNQIRLMAKSDVVGDDLFRQLTQFAVNTPFTIPQVMAGAKNLMAFGFSSNRVLGQLKLAGEWAAMMQMPIDYAAMILGKVRTGGIAQAMRFLQVRGISYADVAAEGGPIDPKTQRTKKGADPEQFLTAINKVIQKKFAGSMSMYMQTLPGMWTNFQDQLILLAAGIGDRIKPQMKDIFHSILSVFDPNLIAPFAQAFGDGLGFVLKMAKAAVTPIALLVVWVMRLSKEHPNFVKFGLASVFVAAAMVMVAGAVTLAYGAVQVLQFAFGAEKLLAFRAGLAGLLGPFGWLIFAAVLFYNIWENNLLGIRTTLEYFGTRIWLVLGGLQELFTSISSGVGTMSTQTADKLGQAGVLGTTVTLFMAFFRLYQFAMGLWDGIKIGVEVMSEIGAVILWATAPVWGIVYALYELGHLMGIVGNQASSSVWKSFGVTVGLVASAVGIASAVTRVWAIWTAIHTAWVSGYNLALGILWVRVTALSIAQGVATAAQWLLNVALTANPIGVIIMGIALLILIIVVVVKHFHQITAWFTGLPTWAKTLFMVLFPMVALPLMIITNWEKIKGWFKAFGTWMMELWHNITAWITDKVVWLVEKLAKVLRHLPGQTGEIFAIIDENAKRREHEKELLASHPGMSMGQINNLSGTHFSHAMDAHTSHVAGKLDEMSKAMHTMGNRPVVVTSTVKLDNKAVGVSVQKYNEAEAQSGR